MVAVAALVPQLTIVGPGRRLLAVLLGALAAGIALLGVVASRRAADSVRRAVRRTGLRRADYFNACSLS